MTFFQRISLNKKLVADDKRPVGAFLFLGLGIVLLLLAYHSGRGLSSFLLREYAKGPCGGVAVVEKEDGSAINDAVVSELREMEDVRSAAGVYLFSAQTGPAQQPVSVSVWALEREQIAELDPRWLSLSGELPPAQLFLMVPGKTARMLGETLQEGDVLPVRISGSEWMPATIALMTEDPEMGEKLGELLNGALFAELEEVERMMTLLYDHRIWPEQDALIGPVDHERMIYRYALVFLKDPKDVREVAERLKDQGYLCVTGFDECAAELEKGRAFSGGAFLAGMSFLLCAMALLEQYVIQRMRNHRNGIEELSDLGWSRNEVFVLYFVDVAAGTVLVSTVGAAVCRIIETLLPIPVAANLGSSTACLMLADVVIILSLWIVFRKRSR